MKRLLILVSAVLFLSGQVFAGFLVDDCDDGDRQTAKGGWWYTYDDSNNGGNSVVEPSDEDFKMSKPGYGGKGYAAKMKGKTGNKLGWDFVGMGCTLTKESSCPDNKPVDISEYKKLEFRIKGRAAGGRLTVVLPYVANEKCGDNYETKSLTDWADYEAAITADVKEEWTLISLDLRKDFKQPKWAKKKADIDDVLKNAHSLSFHFSSADGAPVEITVDDIKFK